MLDMISLVTFPSSTPSTVAGALEKAREITSSDRHVNLIYDLIADPDAISDELESVSDIYPGSGRMV